MPSGVSAEGAGDLLETVRSKTTSFLADAKVLMPGIAFFVLDAAAVFVSVAVAEIPGTYA